MPRIFSTTAYRYPHEHMILALTFFLVLVVIAVTATATLCTGVVFIGLAVMMAYGSSRSLHNSLLQRAHPVTTQSMPKVAAMTQLCVDRLQPGPVHVFITRSNDLNAYTFGLSDPKVVVLYSSLFNVMDEDELRFILGHELGHVKLGHTWLNSLVGGMAGIPSPSGASAILAMAFLWWNRTCELSADRAGLLACGSVDKAISALVKLVAGPQAGTRAGMELAYRQIDAEDDTPMGVFTEAMRTHPMLIRRINEIRQYAGTAEYRRLQGLVDQNLGQKV